MLKINAYLRDHPALAHAVHYTFYILLMVLAVGVIFGIWVNTLSALIFGVFAAGDAGRFFLVVSTVVLVISGIVVVMVGEPYMSRGIANGTVVQRFLKLALPVVLFGVLGWLIRLAIG